MDNSIKMIITEDAAEFDNENLEMFTNFNISVAFCSKDGEELCSRIKHEQPDVVLMDAFMTRLDAIGVMRSIKRQNGKQPLFIVFSSFHSAVLEREIMNAGAIIVSEALRCGAAVRDIRRDEQKKRQAHHDANQH